MTVRWSTSFASCLALIDSGSEASFVDERWAREHDIPLTDLDDSTTVFALDGSIISKVRRTTRPVSLTISGNHQETISFFIFQSPFTPIVLGYP